jgi:PAS domain S-box-containing protein
MLEHPTYEDLEKRVMELEKENAKGRRAETKLREAEDDYRTLVNSLSAGVYRNTGGPKGRFIRANPAIARMFGFDTVEAFMEVSVADLYVDPEERQRFVEEVKRSGFVREWELRLKKRDGTPFWASCTATVKTDERGAIQWMDGIIYDISDRKEAEKALKRVNEVLNNILTASPVGIGLLDKGVIRWANGEMVRMFGFEDRSDYVGKSIRIVYPDEEEYDRVFSVIKNRFKAGEPPEVEANYRRKDGSTFIGHFKVSCPDPEEPSKRAVFAINDISWRAQAEAERLEREKVQAVLETAGAVCHEMNQPLQGVTTLSETLLMNQDEDEDWANQIRRIIDLTGRMGAITKKLMRITKYETKDYIQGVRIIDLDKSSG